MTSKQHTEPVPTTSANITQDGRPLLYLISETKGRTDLSKLQYAHEPQKIKCGRRHFEQALKVPYRVMTSTADLPDSLDSHQNVEE